MSFQKFILPPYIAKFFEEPVNTYLQGISDFIREENLRTILPSSQSPVGIAPSKDLNLIFSSPSFEGGMVENGKYVGGAKIEKTSGYRAGLEDILHYKKGKNVYYSSGTIFWDQTQVKEVIELAKDHEINMFISEGKLFNIKETSPKNVRVYNWIPPSNLDKLIPEMDLVMAQGGLGLTTRSIRSAVPLLIAPIMPGNFPQAVKVDKYGNGIGLLDKKSSLKAAFEEMVYDNPQKYKSKAVQLQKEFDELGGSLRAVELIKDIAYSHSS
jgi:UDP:flavonoid glycosyltransferase YjiC (YdhE family)